ncbi:MAG: PAS domain-containing sensor histidine kinase [Gammaproteobacteria bacterium]|nr:PAS domain-containing sensor histidine kinase [Gammaproteobacteria bacterium]MBU2058145.1 PAS domain-containing sensor histidine kinase [Gammaproteobacteria bacterium]MBU2173491.1 PAS domain-containing sensor histidine kinase [Gammaproteobacteria bacterium]MBU2248781.1 PAS domain-containing sensor histidine kinase [Gammaproteobacteria bacterium]MBU2342691.1 PAS domain-containing sensor histidine kinase [Gammaproteobacteria bacterium]
MAWNSDSIEAQSRKQSLLITLLCLVLVTLLCWFWPYWWVWLSSCCAFTFITRWQHFARQQTIAAFRRSSVQLEAMQNQDYSLQAKAVFQKGIAAQLQHQLQQLSTQLQQRKSYFDEQQFLLYRLIDQLNTPILVFDHKQQLSYANNEFSQLFGRPWQSMRHATAESLGLSALPHWNFVNKEKAKQWQIRQSRFLDQGQRHQLLVFINIQAALRETQLQAWQQLIRVLSHEIRNSLTPVLSLSEHLQRKLPPGRDQEALALIRERSQHLQDFVSRYAELNKELRIQHQQINAGQLFHSLQLLFQQHGLQASGMDLLFQCDHMLLQQVLINLIKNAIEAGSATGTIQLHFRQHHLNLEIQLLDQGSGISNQQDLFVPFYSTKPQGQGIGLALCRQIIEQLGGELNLSNRTDGVRGACATLSLPQD